jgi:hypothetical protein
LIRKDAAKGSLAAIFNRYFALEKPLFRGFFLADKCFVSQRKYNTFIL